MPETQLAGYDVSAAKLTELAAEYLPLKVEGVDDVNGLAVVCDARKVVRDLRISVEKTRKALKADALAYGKKVDAEANRIQGLIAPVETHLASEIDGVAAERKRIADALLLSRQTALSAAAPGEPLPPDDKLGGWSEDAFAAYLAVAKEEQERRQAAEAKRREAAEAEAAELARKQAEAREEMAAEKQKQDASRAEIERVRAALAADQRRLQVEREAVELAQREIRQAAERDRLVKEAEERDRILAEQRKDEEASRALAELAKLERENALRPDREKLASVADVVTALPVPEVGEDLQAERTRILSTLEEAGEYIRQVAFSL